MKKLVVLILSIFYMATSSGATLHMHYCMGILVDLALWEEGNGKCSKCGMNKSAKACENCCSDLKQQVKGAKDQKQVTISVKQISLPAEVANPSFAAYSEALFGAPHQEYPTGNAPPRSSKVDYNILYCIYLI